MIRLCWVFALVAVVVPLSYARPPECEQRERSLADLDLAEDALNRAKDLYPNCEEENESSNSTECSKKDKSLGFLDVALDLVSNAKKNIPICPHVPTEEPGTSLQTEEPVTSPLTEEPTPEVTTENIRLPMDCQELLEAGEVTSGVYSVWPRGETVTSNVSAVRVRCDMDTDGGGWTVIQRRGNFSVQENFDRDWEDYKHGFGSPEREYWLGNDHIFSLTNQGNYTLRMDMTAADGDSGYALFVEFWIEDENANYTLHVGAHIGTVGDSMSYSNGLMFSTKDMRNDQGGRLNCAESRKGGFWYNKCAECNPNGLLKPGVKRDSSSVFYHKMRAFDGLSSIDMKIRGL